MFYLCKRNNLVRASKRISYYTTVSSLSNLQIKNITMLVVNYINIYLFTYTKSKCIAYVIFKLETSYIPINHIII
jgi:hypothetical protein